MNFRLEILNFQNLLIASGTNKHSIFLNSYSFKKCEKLIKKRCVMTTVDYNTGKKDIANEPLKTLNK